MNKKDTDDYSSSSEEIPVFKKAHKRTQSQKQNKKTKKQIRNQDNNKISNIQDNISVINKGIQFNKKKPLITDLSSSSDTNSTSYSSDSFSEFCENLGQYSQSDQSNSEEDDSCKSSNSYLSKNSDQNSVKGKKRSHTVDFELKVVHCFNKINDKKKTARKFNINKKRVQDWVKQRTELEHVPIRDRKSTRTLKNFSEEYSYSELFSSCYSWIKSEWEEGRFVTSEQVIGFFIEEDEDLLGKTYRFLLNLGYKFRQRFQLQIRRPLKRVQYDSSDDLSDLEETVHLEIINEIENIKFFPEQINGLSVHFL